MASLPCGQSRLKGWLFIGPWPSSHSQQGPVMNLSLALLLAASLYLGGATAASSACTGNGSAAPIATNPSATPVSSPDDAEIATMSREGRDVIKIIERYGNCPGSPGHQCLWSRTRIRLRRVGGGGRKGGETAEARSRHCMQRHLAHLQARDPQFIKYLDSRFYMLRNARQHIRQLKSKMEHLLQLHYTANDGPSPLEQNNAQILAKIDQLIQNQEANRQKQHRAACHAMLAHFMQDVHAQLQKMRGRELSLRQTMQQWLRLSRQQKEQLFRILQMAQERDCQKLVRLRVLHDWYQQRLHLLDVKSRQKLERIIQGLHHSEHCYQKTLLARLQRLGQATEQWRTHEQRYKKQLLQMSLQQKYLLDLSSHEESQLRYLSSLVGRNLLPGQRRILAQTLNTARSMRSLAGRKCHCLGIPHGQLDRLRHLENAQMTTLGEQRRVLVDLGRLENSSRQQLRRQKRILKQTFAAQRRIHRSPKPKTRRQSPPPPPPPPPPMLQFPPPPPPMQAMPPSMSRLPWISVDMPPTSMEKVYYQQPAPPAFTPPSAVPIVPRLPHRRVHHHYRRQQSSLRRWRHVGDRPPRDRRRRQRVHVVTIQKDHPAHRHHHVHPHNCPRHRHRHHCQHHNRPSVKCSRGTSTSMSKVEMEKKHHLLKKWQHTKHQVIKSLLKCCHGQCGHAAPPPRYTRSCEN